MKGNLNSFDFSVKCAGRLNYFPRIAANFINNQNLFARVYTGHVQTIQDPRMIVLSSNDLLSVQKC